MLHSRFTIFVCTIALTFFTSYSLPALAQTPSKKSASKQSTQAAKNQITEAPAPVKLQFSHTAPKPEELPSAGLPVKLTVRVNKEALSSGVILRAIITRDGTLFEQQNTSPQIDPSDRINYILEVPSPLVEMTYQFVFIDRSGNAVGTKRYGVRRRCVPDVIFTTNNDNKSGDVSADELRKLGEKLESEIALLDLATNSITQLQEAIDKK